MPPGELSRDELVALVERILRLETSDEEEEDRMVQLFRDSVVHPAASDLIFYPDKHFGPEYHDRMPSAEQIVDAVLAYKPIQLGPG